MADDNHTDRPDDRDQDQDRPGTSFGDLLGAAFGGSGGPGRDDPPGVRTERASDYENEIEYVNECEMGIATDGMLILELNDHAFALAPAEALLLADGAIEIAPRAAHKLVENNAAIADGDHVPAPGGSDVNDTDALSRALDDLLDDKPRPDDRVYDSDDDDDDDDDGPANIDIQSDGGTDVAADETFADIADHAAYADMADAADRAEFAVESDTLDGYHAAGIIAEAVKRVTGNPHTDVTSRTVNDE